MRTRRGVIAGFLASGLLPRLGWAALGNPTFLAAAQLPDDSYGLLGMDADGQALFTVPLPGRGHAAAAHPTRPEAVAFARRPGDFALIIECTTGRQTARLQAPAGRHFYGHGVFSSDGSRLFTTENDYEAGRGVVGVWAAGEAYQRLGEFSSGGIGPHDIARLPNSDTLVVANGGLETHPDSGREKLNLATMQPNLSYLSTQGVRLEQIEMPTALRMNSIRHLAVRPDGLVAFAMQAQSRAGAAVGLIGFHQRGRPAELAVYPRSELVELQGYIGSVAFSTDGTQLALSSPWGGVVHYIDAEQKCYTRRVPNRDVCGIGASAAGFLATAGTGRVTVMPNGRPTYHHSYPHRWDNHLIAAAPPSHG